MDKQFMTSIAPRSVELGPITFDLYTPQTDGRLILFCRRGLAITDRHKTALDRSGRPFYVMSSDIDAYIDYAYERLEEIISKPDIRTRDKAEILHRVGKRTVQKLMENPRSGEAVAQTSSVVNRYIDLILQSDEAAGNLFAISSMDAYTFSHAVNVATFCLMIGEKLFGHDRKTLHSIGLAGMLHDIGKTRIDQHIIFKPGPLDVDEMLAIRKHPLFSYEIIKEHNFGDEIKLAGRSHHERLDGSGYPDKLVGKDIHKFARITAVADVYDAMTSDRIYKFKKPHVDALTEIASDSKQFDPKVFKAMLEIVLRNDVLIEGFVHKHLKQWSTEHFDLSAG